MGGDQRAEVRSQRSEVRTGLAETWSFLWFPTRTIFVRLRGMRINSAKELVVYKRAYTLSMRVFALSKKFPTEERYALTSQTRRASRSVCLNLREAWAKRRYEGHFVSKLTDCDGENSETDSCLDFARDCEYISLAEHRELSGLCLEVGKILGSMILNPRVWVIPSR